MYKPSIGDRVHVQDEFVIGTGTIVFIDQPNLYNHYWNPIQVELDSPYDDSQQIVYRFSLSEVNLLKKGE